jgi:hypothetical protein
MIHLDDQALATVLAALRFYQRHDMGNPAMRSDELHDIATNGGTVISLDDVGIDELCERLNNPDPVQLAITLDGGLIQDIVSDTPEAFEGVEITVIDYDVEGADPGDYEVIAQGPEGDGEADACVSGWDVTQAGLPLPVKILRERKGA